MNDGPRHPLNYESPDPAKRGRARRNPREELIWAFTRGAVIGTSVAVVALAIASGAVTDIAIGFACSVLGAAIFVGTVSSLILFVALELTWRFSERAAGLRSTASATWAGLIQGVIAVVVGAWQGRSGGDFGNVLAWAAGSILIIAALTGVRLVKRE